MDEISVSDVPLLLKLRWYRRRWTLRHLWYRARLPIRRRRWARDRSRLADVYRKTSDATSTGGPAVVLGDFSGTTGISRGAIYDLSKVRERHSSITTIDISEYLAGGKAVPQIREPIENIYFFCQPDVFEHVLGLVTPEAMRNAYRVGRWVWETSELPATWDFAPRLVHEIWTPSDFCGSVFSKATGLPVRTVPHAVLPPPPKTIDMRARLGIARDGFLGLAIMDIKSCPERKNPWSHVRAWQAAFGSDESAVLVMKLRVSKRTSMVLEELQELVGDAKNVKFITDHLSDEELGSLQRSCDVFLSLHRSEGYGLNIHEALLCGKPTVATDWSANHEYGPPFQNYHGVRYRLVPYRDWTNHYENSAFRWADADIAHAAAELRALRDASQERALESVRVLPG